MPPCLSELTITAVYQGDQLQPNKTVFALSDGLAAVYEGPGETSGNIFHILRITPYRDIIVTGLANSLYI